MSLGATRWCDWPDEEVVARWVGNPYWQYLCGFDDLQLALPIDPSSLVRWRRLGPDGIELLLQETIAAAQRSEAVKPQEPGAGQRRHAGAAKAIAHPLDSRLYHRGREILVRLTDATACPCARATPGSVTRRCGWPAATPTPAR